MDTFKVIDKKYAKKLFLKGSAVFRYETIQTENGIPSGKLIAIESVEDLNHFSGEFFSYNKTPIRKSPKEIFEGFLDVIGDVGKGSLILMLGGVASHLITGIVSDTTYKNLKADIEHRRVLLGEKISDKHAMTSFDAKSVVYELNNPTQLTVFGAETTTVTESRTNLNYENIVYTISEEDSKEILQALQAKDASNNLVARNDGSTTMKLAGKDWLYSTPGALKKTANACEKVYDAIEKAIEKSTNYSVEVVCETTQFETSMTDSFQILNQDSSSSTIVNSSDMNYADGGLKLLNVSPVHKNEEEDYSYFMVNTLVRKDAQGNYINKIVTSMVTVEGADLTPAQVYEKFINGEHSSFTEIGEQQNTQNISLEQ